VSLIIGGDRPERSVPAIARANLHQCGIPQRAAFGKWSRWRGHCAPPLHL